MPGGRDTGYHPNQGPPPRRKPEVVSLRNCNQERGELSRRDYNGHRAVTTQLRASNDKGVNENSVIQRVGTGAALPGPGRRRAGLGRLCRAGAAAYPPSTPTCPAGWLCLGQGGQASGRPPLPHGHCLPHGPPRSRQARPVTVHSQQAASRQARPAAPHSRWPRPPARRPGAHNSPPPAPRG